MPRWSPFKDCPHNVFCLRESECKARIKRGASTRDDGQTTVVPLSTIYDSHAGGTSDSCTS